MNLATLAPLAIIIIATAFCAAAVLVFLANLYFQRNSVSERLNTYAEMPEMSPRRVAVHRRGRVSRLRLRLNNMLQSVAPEELGLQLSSADWPITETEYILIRFSGAVGGFLLAWLISRNWLPGTGLAFIAYMVPSLLLRAAIQRRQTAFEHQLVDVLVLVSGAVRAGYSLLQSLDVVIRELRAPASDEFRRVRREIGLGLPLNQALLNLTARMRNDDLYLVVTAINIHAQVGGNLVSMLDAVTETIRDRVRLFGEVRMLTSQQRFNSYILTLIPFGMGAALFILNPNYMSRMFEPGIYLCIPIGAFIMVVLGNITIRRLSKIEV